METLGLKINKKLKTELQTVADSTDRSLSAMARLCLDKGLIFFKDGGSHRSKQKNKFK